MGTPWDAGCETASVPYGMPSYAKRQSMSPVEEVTALLGGAKVLGRKLRTQLDFIPLLRLGLPYGALVSLTDKLELSIDVTSTSLHLARRTLARRKGQDRLDAQESERIVRLADVAAHAAEVLGGLDKARQWLMADNRALGGVAPITLLDTDVGTRAVEDVLIRVHHGVYS